MDRRASLSPSLHVRAQRARTPACAYQPLREEHVGKAVAGLAHDVGAEWSMQRMCIHADRTRCAMLPPLEIEMRTAGCTVDAPLKRRCQKPDGLALAGAIMLRILGPHYPSQSRCRPAHADKLRRYSR